MPCISRRRRTAAPARLALAAFLPLLAAACESEEAKRVKQVAGEYVFDFEFDSATKASVASSIGERTYTFRPDMHWTARAVDPRSGEVTIIDSGTYRVKGAMLTTGATEQSPVAQYTISGDTLWLRQARMIAQAEAVTGVKATGTVQTFLVRRR